MDCQPGFGKEWRYGKPNQKEEELVQPSQRWQHVCDFVIKRITQRV